MPFVFKTPNDKSVLRKAETEKIGLDKTFLNIIKEIINAEYGYEIALKSDIYKVILCLIRIFNVNNDILTSCAKSTLKKIGNAIEFIENNYKDNLSVRSISQHSFLEYSYFSRVFKLITGMSCCDYINNFRIKKSEILLFITNMSISEVGMAVGFDSTSYFIKKFKEINGISPQKFRKEI